MPPAGIPLVGIHFVQDDRSLGGHRFVQYDKGAMVKMRTCLSGKILRYAQDDMKEGG